MMHENIGKESIEWARTLNNMGSMYEKIAKPNKPSNTIAEP
jgi:hypothetical protein